MRGNYHSTGDDLPESDIRELADLLAAQLYSTMERKVYGLSRQDVAELIVRYVEDLSPEDQRSVGWLVWDLFQEGLKIEMRNRRRR
ncbi:MAG TPA: hypothetical protein VLA19_26080 [Herpetosiphonaceae bacterium]|nr:hypothetical protein [Herpetosiphonaceae bacterium]